jgi:colanic acid biosynthesis glycosyl transferase WcaI
MRILIVSQYFAPEVTAASLRLEPLARGLAERGHEVEVVCEVPNHPHGVVPPEFRRKLVHRSTDGGYRASRVWVKASTSKRARARLASYASFGATGLAVGSALRRPDVVVASSPPLSVGLLGALLAARFRVPLVFDVRDLWPQVAVALGEIGPGRVLRAAERLERRLYADAAAITTPTEPFRQHIAAMVDAPGKVHVLPNGTTRPWLEAGDGDAVAGDGGRFVWTYAGNLGLSQNLEVAIEAARLLGDGYRLQLLGDGTARAKLEDDAKGMLGAEVVFGGSVPQERAREIMRGSDALVVLLADVPALSKTVPVKLYDSCAVGRPVVLAAKGESRRLADEHGAALTLDPGDPVALADAIRAVSGDAELRDRLAAGGRRFAEANLRENGVGLLQGVLEEVVDAR